MEQGFWINKWKENQIGFHQDEGHHWLKAFWPPYDNGTANILVPLCGKSRDLIWLCHTGASVTGVELSPIACKDFFSENQLDYTQTDLENHIIFRCESLDLRLACGDYFKFEETGFTHIYDRAALIALPEKMRKQYVAHSKSKLKPGGIVLLITLDYEQDKMSGPPFSVPPEEVEKHWPTATLVASEDTIANEEKFKQAGLTYLNERAYCFKAD